MAKLNVLKSGLSNKISIIIPAYQESKIIAQTLYSTKKMIESVGLDYELIIVDDGSRDKTYYIAKDESNANKKIKVFRNPANKGKGYTIKTGFKHATGEIIAYLDADLNLRPEIISLYIKNLKNADVVIGSKRHPQSNVIYPLHRRILSKSFNLLVRIFFKLSYSDTQCGQKFFKRYVLEDVLPNLRLNRYAFDVELLYNVNKKGYKIVEAPFYYVHKTDKINIINIVRMALNLFGILNRIYITKSY